MRLPYSIQGAFFGPLLIGLSIALKAFCPTLASTGCFVDQFATPIFLPLIFVYKTLGGDLVLAHEIWFLAIYWSLVGFLVGLIFDLRGRRNETQKINVQ